MHGNNQSDKVAKRGMGVAAIVLAGLGGLPTACATGDGLGEHRHANGKLAQQGPLRDGQQTGLWTFWYPDGTVEARGEYAADERTGAWTHYHPDGSLRMQGRYTARRQHGLWTYGFPGGAPQCRGHFAAGREHGEWRFWHPPGPGATDPLVPGPAAQRGCFADGHREGTWSEWSANGELLARGAYRDDIPVGIWQRRDASGALVRFAYPSPAGLEFVQENAPDGTVRREGWRLQGRPDGVWATRHASGELRALARFADGHLVGDVWLFDGAGDALAYGPVAGAPPAPTGVWQVRDGAAWQGVAAPPQPRTPWDRQWSDADLPSRASIWHVAERWLGELLAPGEPIAVTVHEPTAEPAAAKGPDHTPPTVPTLPPAGRPEAPTDPGRWTVRELAELPIFRRYAKDGWLPRNSAPGLRYGGGSDRGRLGRGDAALAAAAIGKPLPLRRFATGDGREFDLDALRGKRVVFVVLRGFATQVCVYCFTQTTELAAAAAAFAALDTEIVVMFPGSKGQLAAFQSACKEELGEQPPPFPMLFDADLTLARALGLQGDLARPAAFVLDRDGVVRFAYVAESSTNIADRPSAEELLRAVDKL